MNRRRLTQAKTLDRLTQETIRTQILPPAYDRLSWEDQAALCRKLPGELPFLPREVLTAERLERRLAYLLSKR